MEPYAVLGGGRQPTVILYQGDVRAVLAQIPAQRVHCVVTSPPYWGLRDYGVPGQLGLEPVMDCLGWATGPACGGCYVCHMVAVFRAVHRVLREDGTLWLNLGDGYAHDGTWGGETSGRQGYLDAPSRRRDGRTRRQTGLKPKDLCGLPWRVALALQADGWTLRQDIVFAKQNPLPEAVQDRCTRAHDYLFLLTKQPSYYWDALAISEPASAHTQARKARTREGQPRLSDVQRPGIGSPGLYPKAKVAPAGAGIRQNPSFSAAITDVVPTRNKRSVWAIVSEPLRVGHYAAFPTALVRPCILAGTSAYGVCGACGAPYRRVVERSRTHNGVRRDDLGAWRTTDPGTPRSAQGDGHWRYATVTATRGWAPTCACHAPVARPVILDGFGGSGTTALVALQHGRDAILIDLNQGYLDLAIQRVTPALAQLDLFGRGPA